ncbi:MULTISPECIES: hypothetical protein [Rhodonellum]|nr:MULTISPECIES: hypothetical protein [Rhodonellum]
MNFLNLSASFYQSAESQSIFIQSQDPLDTLTELVLEYFLEMDDDTVPDTEVPGGKRSLLDLKMNLPHNFWKLESVKINLWHKHNTFYTDFSESLSQEIDSPPPKS